MVMDVESGFVLDRQTYTPREAAMIFSAFVHRVTLPTMYRWLQMYRNGDGSDGLENSATPSGRFLIPAEALRELLLKHGAKEAGGE